MAKQFITAQIMIFRLRKIKGGRHDVVHPSTADAAEVVVCGGVGIETSIAPGVLELLNQPHAGQQVKVAVDRAQAQLRQSPPDKFVKLDRRWMGSNGLQFFENNLSLSRISMAAARLPFRREGGSQQAIGAPQTLRGV